MGGGIFEYVEAFLGGYRHMRCNLIIMATGLIHLYSAMFNLFDIVDGTSVLERWW